MNPILKRTLSGLAVGAAVIAFFLYCPLGAVFPVLLVVSALVQLEFYQMAKAYEPVKWFGLLLGAAWITATAATPMGALLLLSGLVWAFPFALLAAFAILCGLVLFSRAKSPIGSVAVTLLGFFYVPFLLSFFLRFAQLEANAAFAMPESRVGLYTLLVLIAVTKFSDTGGFAFGMAFGRHKMCPTISPNKSWEGLLGSVLFSAGVAAVGLACARRFGWAEAAPFWGELSYPLALGLGAVTALVATLGDLVESRFKRECGVKDSATFMPAGMGGFLDMFDSLLFIPALAYAAILARMCL